jgi:hypothetical protein
LAGKGIDGEFGFAGNLRRPQGFRAENFGTPALQPGTHESAPVA